MDRVFFFDFDSRTWSSRATKDNLPGWTFAHATKRGRCVFALGSVQGETGTLEVGPRVWDWTKTPNPALLTGPTMEGHSWHCDEDR